jgi:hypothetical protein
MSLRTVFPLLCLQWSLKLLEEIRFITLFRLMRMSPRSQRPSMTSLTTLRRSFSMIYSSKKDLYHLRMEMLGGSLDKPGRGSRAHRLSSPKTPSSARLSTMKRRTNPSSLCSSCLAKSHRRKKTKQRMCV